MLARSSERPLPSFMLFKTLSAAVFGIDAYLVEAKPSSTAPSIALTGLERS